MKIASFLKGKRAAWAQEQDKVLLLSPAVIGLTCGEIANKNVLLKIKTKLRNLQDARTARGHHWTINLYYAILLSNLHANVQIGHLTDS